LTNKASSPKAAVNKIASVIWKTKLGRETAAEQKRRRNRSHKFLLDDDDCWR